MSKKPPIKKSILRVLSQKSITPVGSVKQNTRNVLIAEEAAEPKIDYAITRSLKNLVSSGLVEVFRSEHDEYLRLTPLGRQNLQNMALEGDSSLVPTVWDG